MADPEQARAAQLNNIEAKTGRDLAALCAAIASPGQVKHGEVRSWVMETFGLGFGDANGPTTHALKANDRRQAPTSGDAFLSDIHSGKKAHLREVHDAMMGTLSAFGDFEVAAKNDYLSLRRKKQFATLGPKSAERVEVGINLKDEIAGPRFVAAKPGGMCQYTVALRTPAEVDEELRGVLRRAFDAAG